MFVLLAGLLALQPTLVISAGTFALAYPVDAALIYFGVKQRTNNPAEMGQSQGTRRARAAG